ncbi:Rpn family recombination-promoting nuclease/putative transposase [Candidatus Electrothrix laxa]
MRAANPIYDVVFKYLMGDMRIAKLILSKILDQEVEALDLRPTEFKKKIGLNLTVFRIDFSAKIRQADGSHRLVLIEIQKAKLPTDIMRFRKYLGGHYQDQNNVYQTDGGSREKALPIICIYFLGHPLEHATIPVIKVERSYIDAVTQEELTTREEFIESLTHDSYIIQIPRLREKRRNKLEVLLSIFDQSQQTPDSRHFLDLDEADYPKEFQRVVRRLVKAGAEQDVCETMDLEDDILDELESLERTVLLREKALEENAKALAEKDEALAESAKALTEKNEALAENAKALAEKDRALERAVQTLVASGMTEDDAKRSLGLFSENSE